MSGPSTSTSDNRSALGPLLVSFGILTGFLFVRWYRRRRREGGLSFSITALWSWIPAYRWHLAWIVLLVTASLIMKRRIDIILPMGGMIEFNSQYVSWARWMSGYAHLSIASAVFAVLCIFRFPKAALVATLISLVTWGAAIWVSHIASMMAPVWVLSLQALAILAALRAQTANSAGQQDTPNAIAHLSVPEPRKTLVGTIASDRKLRIPAPQVTPGGPKRMATQAASPAAGSRHPLPPQVTSGGTRSPVPPLPPQVTPVHRQVAESTVVPAPQPSPGESTAATARPLGVEPAELDQHSPQLLPDPLAVRPADV